ncbi:hypothetical protein [Nocardia nepalensis]|uniref:hypothetical protein n=1 Tax=Nocardia nepalensis TaxID=3375448 RepID=UPI003B66DA10
MIGAVDDAADAVVSDITSTTSVETMGRTAVGSAKVVAPFAVGPDAAVAAAAGLILVVRAGRYDYFGDELYFLAAGRRLSVGYVDQGPLIPLVARLMDMIAPGSLVTLSLPSIIMSVAGIASAAALAREFGSGRGAQLLAGLGYASCPFLITQAAAIDRLGGADLPAVYSPNRGFAFFGTPPDSATTVLYVTTGAVESRLRPLFSQVEPIIRVDDPLGFPGISSGVTVWKCLRPTNSCSELWKILTTPVLDPDP